ncbi:hypothetical protein KIV56_11375 [Cryobacterium breve]|uniref:Uncharacterized protein n=1 Tax=Cryobacterium breve TaxID=1259258 RepID=A0ABY7NL66_9MICO|nr:hypothetical protein [Cryobacterium breve]WBM81636.1 hypothetical protein KIV56_11375 [Cryobacterium breve]
MPAEPGVAVSLTRLIAVIELSTDARSRVSGRSVGRPAAVCSAAVGVTPGRLSALAVSCLARASRYWRTKPPAL